MSDGHITQRAVKLNDTYFNTKTYNSPSWRSLVMCQEIGHTLGLAHWPDEDFNTDSSSCMDYTSAPSGNEMPYQHDFDTLDGWVEGETFNDEIYTHSDSSSTTTVSASLGQQDGGNSPRDWGRVVHFTEDRKPHVYVKELGAGKRMITDVFWAR